MKDNTIRVLLSYSGEDVLTNSSIVTSIILWLKYAGLFLTTLTATISCVLIFWHLTTWPNVPCPRTSRMRYLLLDAALGMRNTDTQQIAEIHVLVALLCPKPVVDVQDVVIIFIVITVVVSGLTRLCQHPPRIERSLVAELGITNIICLGDLCCQAFQRLGGR